MSFRTNKFLMLILLIGACDASPPEADVTAARGLSAVLGTTDEPAFVGNEEVKEVKLLIEKGAAVLASQRGDLNGDGSQDVVLVLDHPADGEGKLGRGEHRSLLLFVRDDSGKLSKAGQNDTIVPCATCGGMVGDPFCYVRVGNGTFTVVVEGGSRERWFDEYVFDYSMERDGWFLDSVNHGLTDTFTGEAKQTEMTSADFGVIGFDEFDPSKLPSEEGI